MVERRYRSRTGWAAGVAEDAGGEDMPGRMEGDNGTLSTMAAAERAVLVGADLRSPQARSRDGSAPKDGRAGATLSAADSLAELEQLAWTAGAEVVGTLTQKLDRPDSATFLVEH